VVSEPNQNKQPVKAEQLQGFKQMKQIAGLLRHLHECGCDRDKAGNRELHFDDYVLLVLLYLFCCQRAQIPQVR
jgi:hypothetical protein